MSSLLLVVSRLLLVNVPRVLLVATVGTSWRVTSCAVVPDGWIVPHLAFGTHLNALGGLVGLLNRFSVHHFCLLPGCLLWIKRRGSKSAELQRAWEIYDDRLQLLARLDALSLDESLGAGDVSRAWLVWSSAWSSAAETALADAFRFAGGPVPEKGLIMGRGTAPMRVVRLGGPEVREARKNAADAHEGLHV